MSTSSYFERLHPSVGFLIALGLSAPLVLLSVLPVSETYAIALAGVVPLALIALSVFSAPTIKVDENLSAGRIRIPISALGNIEVVSGDALKHERGPGLSPASQFLIRGDIKTMVKIQVVDPADPTSYLLISTRNPEALASALDANRS